MASSKSTAPACDPRDRRLDDARTWLEASLVGVLEGAIVDAEFRGLRLRERTFDRLDRLANHIARVVLAPSANGKGE